MFAEANCFPLFHFIYLHFHPRYNLLYINQLVPDFACLLCCRVGKILQINQWLCEVKSILPQLETMKDRDRKPAIGFKMLCKNKESIAFMDEHCLWFFFMLNNVPVDGNKVLCVSEVE